LSPSAGCRRAGLRLPSEGRWLTGPRLPDEVLPVLRPLASLLQVSHPLSGRLRLRAVQAGWQLKPALACDSVKALQAG
jgi:hypothetical protein